MKFVTIRAIRVTERPIRHLRGKFHKIPELWLAVPLEGLYENLFSVKSKSSPITSAHWSRRHVHRVRQIRIWGMASCQKS